MKFFLGIDVSKGYADFAFLDEHKNLIEKNFQLDDTFQGHNALCEFIRSLFAKFPDATLYAAVESTGGYENNWLNVLKRLQNYYPLSSARLNAKGVFHNTKASLKRVVTDKVSAQSIAEYLISYPEKVQYHHEDEWAATRNQWTFIQMLIKQKTQLSNQLDKILYQANPELMVYWRNQIPNWMLHLLHHYPTAQRLAQADAKEVAQISYISYKKAHTLIERAKESVASTTDTVTEHLIKSLVQEILHQQSSIDQQKKLLTSNCTLPEVQLLESIIGIGTYSAIGLLLHIGTIERFVSVKKLASFWGVHPKFKQSGDGVWSVRMSKEGHSAPRAILFMATLVAIRHNPVIREVFHTNLKKGKCKMDAIGVCMHKLLRIIYGILKSKTTFDPKIDERNRERNQFIKTGKTERTLRRFQKMDERAPISRRQNKKRKEQNQSQDDNIIACEILAPALSDSVTKIS
jgi:transposase